MLVALTSLTLGLLARGLSATPLTPRITGTKYLFVFGDSYTSSGFNINGAKPSAANPMGNPPLPGNTAVGGLSWAEYLATQFNTSLTLTFNFAVAGATVDNSIVQAYIATVPGVVDQVNTWNKNLASKPSYAPWTAENALVAIWIGVNDVGNSYTQSGEEARLNKDLDRYFEQLEVLYKGGVRNYALLNIPPTQKTPKMKNQAKVANLVDAITLWNGQLPDRVTKFKTANSEANVVIVDTQAPFNVALGNPKDYGAQNADCINSNAKSCLWFDNYHPGSAISKLVAQTVAAAFKGTFF